MITTTDIIIAYSAGLAGGALLPLIIIGIRAWLRARREAITLRHWRSTGLFRG
jgi:hypothetical protein